MRKFEVVSEKITWYITCTYPVISLQKQNKTAAILIFNGRHLTVFH